MKITNKLIIFAVFVTITLMIIITVVNKPFNLVNLLNSNSSEGKLESTYINTQNTHDKENPNKSLDLFNIYVTTKPEGSSGESIVNRIIQDTSGDFVSEVVFSETEVESKVSPDGLFIAYNADKYIKDNHKVITVHNIVTGEQNSFELVNSNGTESITGWSPDGIFIHISFMSLESDQYIGHAFYSLDGSLIYETKCQGIEDLIWEDPSTFYCNEVRPLDNLSYKIIGVKMVDIKGKDESIIIDEAEIIGKDILSNGLIILKSSSKKDFEYFFYKFQNKFLEPIKESSKNNNNILTISEYMKNILPESLEINEKSYSKENIPTHLIRTFPNTINQFIISAYTTKGELKRYHTISVINEKADILEVIGNYTNVTDIVITSK